MPKQDQFDLLGDSLRDIVYLCKYQDLFKHLSKKDVTNFNLREVKTLSLIRRKVVSVLGPMTRLTFRDVLHSGFDYTENVRHLLVDRIFSTIDEYSYLQLYATQWNKGLSVWLRGTLDEKIAFAYKVYDTFHNNRIKKEQIFAMMRASLVKQQSEDDPEEAVRDMIEFLMKKLDLDRDGKVSFKDFEAAIKLNPLLLECMGPVFPTREAANAFETTFTCSNRPF